MAGQAEKQECCFVCDDNLGKLARYLRVCGFDTAFDINISDSEIIRLSLDEERIILTRDHKLVERTLVRNFFLIVDNRWPDQMKKVFQQYRLGIRKSSLFTRCPEDNNLIVDVEKEKIKNLVYPYTFLTHDIFKQCPFCRRVYWSGTHVSVMITRLRDYGFKIND
jgi:hypothetical protein